MENEQREDARELLIKDLAQKGAHDAFDAITRSRKLMEPHTTGEGMAITMLAVANQAEAICYATARATTGNETNENCAALITGSMLRGFTRAGIDDESEGDELAAVCAAINAIRALLDATEREATGQ
jgi:hypothetical protein